MSLVGERLFHIEKLHHLLFSAVRSQQDLTVKDLRGSVTSALFTLAVSSVEIIRVFKFNILLLVYNRST